MILCIWLVLPSPDAISDDARKAVTKLAAEHDVTLLECTAALVKDPRGRPLHLLPHRQADELYRALHRDFVGVLDLARAAVRHDPRHERPWAEATLGLPELVRYKAIFARGKSAEVVRDVEALVTQLKEALALHRAAPPCDLHDPRPLPRLCFDGDLAGLDDATGRAEFKSKFHHDGDLLDNSKKLWGLTPAQFHGISEHLSILAGVLTDGFHWDVTVSRGTAHVHTATGVWSVKEKQYLNVAPNMYVRIAGKKQHRAKQVWAFRGAKSS